MNIDDNDHHRTRTLELPYEQPPSRPSRRRSSSAGRQSALQIRASNLVKKLGILTSKLGQGGRIKQASISDSRPDTPLAENYPYHKARSMDVLRPKPYMSSPMLSMGFDSKQLARSSADGSQESGSDLGEVNSAHARKKSNSNSIAQGLAVAAMVAGASLRSRAPEGQDGNVTLDTDIGATLSGRPSNAIKGNKVDDTSVRAADSYAYGFRAPPPPEKRPVHPRLSTLPPLTFNLKGAAQDSRPQRFSPSVVVRPPPFPILELPPLPTPIAETSASGSQAQSRSRRGGARLNSMPMLPMEGAHEGENDPDHENCVLDEDEEGDDDENEDDGIGGNDAAGSEDEDEETTIDGQTTSSSNATPSSSASFFSRTRTVSPLLTLPAINTPSLSSLLGGIGSGSSGSSQSVESSESISSAGCGHNTRQGSASENPDSIKPSRDDLPTPKAARSNHVWGGLGNGSSQADYFSTSGPNYPRLEDSRLQDIDKTKTNSYDNRPPHLFSATTSASSTLRTPTARDPGPQIPMISVAPPSAARTETDVSGSVGRPWKDSGLIAKGLGSDAAVPRLSVSGAPKRPSIYHHASKSMIELFTVDVPSKITVDSNGVGLGVSERDIKGKGKLHSEDSVMKLHSPAEGQKVEHALRISGRDGNVKVQEKPLPSNPSTAMPSDSMSPSLRRQRSMPTFSTSGSPPPYPSFPLPEHLRHFVPLPRDDEGVEELPAYSNNIRLAAVMPRKMEFNAPGVPSRDRKWRRVHCVLEGTAFRIYDAPPRVTGVSALGGWWERKVGVGNMASGGGVSGALASSGATTNIVIGRKDPKKRMKWEEEMQAEEDIERAESGTGEGRPRPSTSSADVNIGTERPRSHRSKLNVAASLLHPNRSKHSLVHAQGLSASPASPRSSFHSPRTSAESSDPPPTRSSVDLSTSTSSSSGLSSATVSADFASSSSLSALSTSSSSSSHTRRRGHQHSDSAQSSIISSRSSSRAQSPLNPDSRSRPQYQDSTLNTYLYHSIDSSDLPDPEEKDLLRLYSLQNAESGLASDYIKRSNVVRVRMEGEQFLLQCKDVASVVEWIEGLQAATNIAPDLDERPMPKGPIFPRRRRRRHVPTNNSGSGQAASSDTVTGTGTGSSDRTATTS